MKDNRVLGDILLFSSPDNQYSLSALLRAGLADRSGSVWAIPLAGVRSPLYTSEYTGACSVLSVQKGVRAHLRISQPFLTQTAHIYHLAHGASLPDSSSRQTR